ncbi:hypothetical protein [Rosistilla oblonga]|uniref:hypothetical protein n=1 Tax=Rosistilla oblonga TaxID=2527990 RepID=UPI003A975A50
MFSNREIASVIWLLVFMCWLLTRPNIRKSIGHLFRAFSESKFVACVFAMIVYVASVTYAFWLIGLWEPLMTKDTVLWFVLTGFVLLMQFMSSQDSNNVFRLVLRDSVRLVIFFEFLIGAYAFPLWAEMLFVPVVTILIVLDTFAGTAEKSTDFKKMTGLLIAVIGFGILLFAINRALDDWRSLGTVGTFRSIAFAPLMSIAFIPFIYGAMLVAAYDTLFSRLDFGRGQRSAVKRYAQLRILKHCKLSLKKLRDISTESFRLRAAKTDDDVDRLFDTYP